MIGLVLAAGAGRRLRPYTDSLPKALVPVGPAGIEGEPTVLDLTLANFAEIGLTEVAVIVGYRKEAVYERKAALEAKYGLKLTLIDNDKAEEWNNAYSLWCGRDALKDGVILANGDTVHPVSVEKTLLVAVLAAALTASQFPVALTVLAVAVALVVLLESIRFWVSAGAPAVHDEGEPA